MWYLYQEIFEEATHWLKLFHLPHSGIPTDVLGSTPQRHHVVVWPTEEIALNVWSGWMVLLYISGPSRLPPKRNLVFFSPPNWALKTSSNGKAPNFEAPQNRWLFHGGILKTGHSLKLTAPTCQEATPKDTIRAGCQFSGDIPELSPSLHR